MRVGVAAMRMQRADTEVVPDERVDETKLATEAVRGRLAFPERDRPAQRRTGTKPALAERTDQTDGTYLVLGKLMREAAGFKG